MSVAAVKIKFMPSSLEADLSEIEVNIRKILERNSVRNPQFDVEPIAFGLKAIIVMFGWPEEKELDSLETELQKIPDVSSVQIIDIRRAIG